MEGGTERSETKGVKGRSQGKRKVGTEEESGNDRGGQSEEGNEMEWVRERAEEKQGAAGGIERS